MIILVTGGASGLGESITRKLAHQPANMVYFTYNQSAANAKKIETDFPNAVAIKYDFKNEADVNSLKDQIATLNPDVLINNAYMGAFMNAYFHKTPVTDFLARFKENIIPTIIITQAAIQCFRKKKHGKIITILTAALLDVPPVGAAVYTAGKAYLQQLAKSWAAENSPHHITSNTVSPAFMLTGFTNHTDERVLEQLTENHPLKKLLTTDEVADTVFFLTNASEQINGIDIILNAAANIK